MALLLALLPTLVAALTVVIKFGVQKVEAGKVRTKVFRIAEESSAWPSFETFVEDCKRRFASSSSLSLRYVDTRDRNIDCENDEDLHGFLEDAEDANQNKQELTLVITDVADQERVQLLETASSADDQQATVELVGAKAGTVARAEDVGAKRKRGQEEAQTGSKATEQPLPADRFEDATEDSLYASSNFYTPVSTSSVASGRGDMLHPPTSTHSRFSVASTFGDETSVDGSETIASAILAAARLDALPRYTRTLSSSAVDGPSARTLEDLSKAAQEDRQRELKLAATYQSVSAQLQRLGIGGSSQPDQQGPSSTALPLERLTKTRSNALERLRSAGLDTTVGAAPAGASDNSVLSTPPVSPTVATTRPSDVSGASGAAAMVELQNLGRRSLTPESNKDRSGGDGRTRDDAGPTRKPERPPNLEPETGPAPRQLTQRQTYSRYVYLCVAYALILVPYSMMAPFFDEEAAQRGVTGEGLVGLIYGATDIFGFFWVIGFAQALTWYPSFFRRRNMLIGGMAIGGAATALFGLMALVHGSTAFILLCVLLRVLLGLGTAVVIQVVYAGMATLFHAKGNQMATAMGGMDAIGAIGWIGSPFIGGVLYSADGFYLSFVVVGGAILVLWCLPAVAAECFGADMVLETSPAPSQVADSKQPPEPRRRAPTMLQAVKNWRIVVVLVVTVLAAMGNSYINPILGPFLATKGLSESFRGTFFLYAAVSYAVFGVLAGLLADRVIGHWKTILLGLLLQFVTFALLGPLPLFPDDTSYWIVAPGMVCLGAASAFSYTPVLPLMLDVGVATTGYSAAELGDVLTGLYTAAYLGTAGVTPIISDALAKAFGYRTACFIPAMVNLGAFFVLGTIRACDVALGRRRGRKEVRMDGEP